MRSFFNKPAWAAAGDESNTSSDFYRRSKQTYDDIIATNRQRQRETSTTPNPPSNREPTKPSKRRRVTKLNDEPEPLDDSVTDSLNGDLNQGSGKDHDEKNVREKVEIVAPKSPAITTPPPSNEDSVIAIESSPEPTNAYENESYNASFKNVKADSHLDDGKSTTSNEPGDKIQNNTTNRANSSQPSDQAIRNDPAKDVPDESDGIVQIYISSQIENTKPLMVHRRMSQRFRDVRIAWCERQGFDNKMTSSVYLTWNKRRLFDVTTCRSLDLKGRALSPVYGDSRFGDEVLLRIHVEAVTDELLKSQADAALRPSSSSSSAKPRKSATESEPPFSIALRSRDHEDIWIKVRKRTKVSQILNDFRARMSVPDDVNIQLSFDGDILDPGSRLEVHDIAEDDLVEVLLK